MDPITLLTMLDEQDEAFRNIYPKYKPIYEAEQTAQAKIDQRNAALSSAARSVPPSSSQSSISQPSSQSSTTAASSTTETKPSTGGTSYSSLISMINPGTSVKTTTLELSHDTDLFRTPLLATDQSWSSTKAVEGGKVAENLLIKLPNYMIDPFVSPDGRNTLLVCGEYFKIPGYNRVYGAINIGDVLKSGGSTLSSSSSSSSSSTAPTNESAILNRDVIAQVSFRIDPNKTTSSSLSGSDNMLNMRYRYQQTYKVAGRWESTLSMTKNFSATQWPFTEHKLFYIRLIMDPRGVFSYVDGKAFSYTPYPPGWKPEDPHALVVQIPIAGDAGEKATWKINGLWWGRCRTDEGGDKIYREYLKTTNASSTVQTIIENEIYITGLPVGAGDAAIRDALMDAFRMYGAIEVKKETVGYVVVVRDPSRVTEAITATDRRITILGSVVNVKKAIRTLDRTIVGGSTGSGSSTGLLGSAGRSSIGSNPSSGPMTSRSTPGYSPYTGSM